MTYRQTASQSGSHACTQKCAYIKIKRITWHIQTPQTNKHTMSHTSKGANKERHQRTTPTNGPTYGPTNQPKNKDTHVCNSLIVPVHLHICAYACACVCIYIYREIHMCTYVRKFLSYHVLYIITYVRLRHIHMLACIYT